MKHLCLTTRVWLLLRARVLVSLLVTGCGAAAPAPRDATITDAGADAAVDAAARNVWPCPATWVPAAVGGCGPAVLLCVPDGGAAPLACDGVDITRSPTLALPDGGTVRGFYRLPDGGIGGEWPEPGDARVGIETCPAGWQRLDDGTCDARLRSDCPAGSEPLPGGACTPTALSDCPAGDYADPGVEAMGATVVHVRADATPAGADGSLAHPYASLAEGVWRAGAGGWVLAAAGEYRERLVVRDGVTVHVVGVCAARVTLRGMGSTGVFGATADVEGARTTLDLRGITVTGTGRGVQARNGAIVRGAGIVITGAAEFGAAVLDATTQMTFDGCVVRDTRPLSNGDAGMGLLAQSGAALRATGSAIVANTNVGLHLQDARTAVEVRDSVVRATRPRADRTFGYGTEATTGARLDLRGVLVVDNVGVGVVAANAGTALTITSSIVRGTTGPGVLVSADASLLMRDSLVVDNAVAGLVVVGGATRATITSTTVRDTRPDAMGQFGDGLIASEGASVDATRLLLARNGEVGVLALGGGTRAMLVASVVRETRPRSVSGQFGRGIVVLGGATLHASGVLVDDNRETGVDIEGAMTSATLDGCAVRGTRVQAADRGPSPDGILGIGLDVEGGATLDATGLLVADNVENGLFTRGGGTRSMFTDTLFSEVSPSTRGFGVGLYVMQQARVEGARLGLQSLRGAGVIALPFQGVDDAQVRIRELFVRDVAPNTIRFNEAGGTVSREGVEVAYGLHAGHRCTIDAEHAVLDGRGLGLFNASGVVSLHQAVIAHQREGVGAVDFATPGDATRLDGVTFVENADNEVVRRNDLPGASALPAPPPVMAP